MQESRYKLPAAPKPAPAAYRAELKRRGWRKIDAAARWGISREHLTRLIADPDRPAQWNDALYGLPILDLALRNELRRRGPRKTPPTRAPHPVARDTPQDDGLASRPGYLYHGSLVPGAIVTAMEAIGTIAQSGDEGVVVAVDANDHGELYRIRFPGGEQTFGEADVLRSLNEAGIVDPSRLG